MDTSELREGDIIAFYSELDEIKGELVTHRIAKVNSDGTFVTRGDANPVDDSLTVRPEQVLGKYTGKTRFFIWLHSLPKSFGDDVGSTKKWVLLAIMIAVAIGAVYELRSVVNIGKEINEDKKAEAERNKQRLIREEIEKEKRRLEEQGGIPEEVKKNESR